MPTNELATDTAVCPADLPTITGRMLGDPETLGRLREQGPAHHVDMGGRETGWLLTSYDDACRALVHPRMTPEPPWAARTAARTTGGELLDEEELFFLPEAEHVRLRRLITRQLTYRRVERLAGRIQRQVDLLVDAMPLDASVDFVASFARPLPVAVLCELLGVPEPGRRFIVDYVNRWIPAVSDAAPVTESDSRTLVDYLRALIAQRRAAPEDDLISAMAADGDERDVLSAIRLLIIAGNHPVTRLLAGGLPLLLDPRARWLELVADPSRVDATVEELLRVVSPVSLSSRYVTEETEFAGVTLPRGSGVHCALVAANHDPARFDDPGAFDPRRPANQHVAFGLGRKHCLGVALARAQARIAVGTLARRCPDLRLVADRRTAGRRQLLVVLGASA